MRPRRVRLGGDLYHPVVPDGAVDVTRNGPYGNPHPVNKRCRICKGIEHSRGGAVLSYKRTLQDDPALVERIRRELAGKDLACWCWPSEACHGDVLLAVAAGEEP